MKLSKNLSLKEMTKSNTAIKRGFSNAPDNRQLANLRGWAINIFQPLRDHFKTAIFISSGFRSLKLNIAIGGSKTSQHSKGEAGDIDADVFKGVTNAEIFHYIKDNLDFDQLIWEFGDDEEPNWVHASYKLDRTNRGEILIASRVEGRKKAIYTYY